MIQSYTKYKQFKSLVDAKERAFFLGSEEQEGHQDDSDSEMEMVVSHEELLQTLQYREFVDSRGSLPSSSFLMGR
jgi:hypothetical protein